MNVSLIVCMPNWQVFFDVVVFILIQFTSNAPTVLDFCAFYAKHSLSLHFYNLHFAKYRPTKKMLERKQFCRAHFLFPPVLR